MAKVKGPRVRKAPTVKEQPKTESSLDKPTKRRRLRFWYLLAKNPIIRLIWTILRPLAALLWKVTPKYVRNSWQEVRQVTWPNRRETWRLTIAVFIFAIVFGGLVAIIDKGIDEIFKKVILK